jgi:hypothetical protein
MKKFQNVIIASVFIFLLSSCETPQRFIVTTRLTPPFTVRPFSPGIGGVWIEGEWFWNGRNYDWRNGYWSHPINGYRWVPGNWKSRSSGWYWHTGHWRK